MKKAGLKSEYLNITSEVEVVGGSVTTKYYKILDPLQIGDFKIKNCEYLDKARAKSLLVF